MIIKNFIKISWNFAVLSASPANGSNIIETEITTATHNNNNQTHHGTLLAEHHIHIHQGPVNEYI